MTVLKGQLAKNKARNGMAATNQSVTVTETSPSDNDKELPHVVESKCSLPLTAADKKCSPTVQMNHLFSDGDTNGEAFCAVGSPEWFIWLDSATKFRYYTMQTIHVAYDYHRSMRPISVRKEKRRHGFFWCAYLRIHGHLNKRYVGRSQDLTLEKLDEIAAILNEIW